MSNTRITLPMLVEYIMTEVVVPITNHEPCVMTDSDTSRTSPKIDESKSLSKLPENLKIMLGSFTDEIEKVGTKKKITKDILANDYTDTQILIDDDTLDKYGESISFYYSILTIVVPDFNTFSGRDQTNYVTKLRDKLIIHVSGINFSKSFYGESGWSKKDTINFFVQFQINKVIMKLTCDFFNLNLFLVDVDSDSMQVISDDNVFDCFRQNCVILMRGNSYEPITFRGKYIFETQNDLIRHLITVHKDLMNMVNMDLRERKKLSSKKRDSHVIKMDGPDDCQIPFTIGLSDLRKLMPKQDVLPVITALENIVTQSNGLSGTKTLEEVETDHQNQYAEIIPPNTETETNTNTNTVSRPSVSLKMKLEELQLIASQMNIGLEKERINAKTKKVTKKVKTKQELIDEINLSWVDK